MWPKTSSSTPPTTQSHSSSPQTINWSYDIDLDDDYTDTEEPYIPRTASGVPLPETTLRRLEGYDLERTFQRHFYNDNIDLYQKQQIAMKKHIETLLPPGVSSELNPQLQSTLNDLTDVDKDAAFDVINKVAHGDDRQRLLAHYTAGLQSNEAMEHAARLYFQANEKTLTRQLAPMNINDPMAWAQLPLVEAQQDLPGSHYSKFVQNNLFNTSGNTNPQINPSQLLFSTANPLQHAQQSYNITSAMEQFDGTLSDISIEQLQQQQQLKLKEDRLNLLTDLNAVQKSLQQINRAIDEAKQQLFNAEMMVDNFNPGLNQKNNNYTNLSDTDDDAHSTASSTSTSSPPTTQFTPLTLPSQRHQLMINLSSLITHRTTLEQQFNALKIKNKAKYAFSTNGDESDDDFFNLNQHLYDLTTDSASSTQSTNQNTKQQQEWSYWSYLNPFSYGTGSNPTTTTQSNPSPTTSTSSVSSSSRPGSGDSNITTTSMSNSNGNTTTTTNNTDNDDDFFDNVFTTPYGYNVSLPNNQYLHIDVAHLSLSDQRALQSRDLLEDTVSVLFGNPTFITKTWELEGLNEFVRMYNQQEDSKWNLYQQLLQAWYLSKKSNDKNDKNDDKKAQKPQDKNRITPDTWEHITTDLKQFKALMDMQLLGLIDQINLQHEQPNILKNNNKKNKLDKKIEKTSQLDTLPVFIDPADSQDALGSKLRKLFFGSNNNNNNNNNSSSQAVVSSSLPIPSPDEFLSLAYFQPYTYTDAISLPSRFDCIKSYLIHLFNTNRLSNDFRVLIDIDLTNLSHPQYIFLDPTIVDNDNNNDDSPEQQNVIIQGSKLSLTKSPSATIFFDPNYQKRVQHWTQKSWAKDIITHRRNYLKETGEDATFFPENDSSNQKIDLFGTNNNHDDQSELVLIPGSDNYLQKKQDELNKLQTSMSLPHTDLPHSIQQRHQQLTAESQLLGTENQAFISPAQIKQFWEEDERAINLLLLAQQRQSLPQHLDRLTGNNNNNVNADNDDDDDQTKLSQSEQFNIAGSLVQIPRLFHPLHGLDRFLAAQQDYFNLDTNTANNSQPSATAESFLGQFAINTPSKLQNTSQETPLTQLQPCSKLELQLYDYIQHFLTQEILTLAEEFPHLRFVPISSPLNFVQGQLLPSINPLLSLTPTLVSNENPIPPLKNPKFRKVLHFIHSTLLASPTAVPSTLEFLDQIRSNRMQIRQKEQEEDLNTRVFGSASPFTNNNNSSPDGTPSPPQPTSPFAHTPLTTPVLDSPMQPHPRDFLAVLLWDSLDPEQRRLYSLPRRVPRTGVTAWQDSEYTRPGLARHPFNRAFVRTDDTNHDIFTFRGGLPEDLPEDQVSLTERLEQYKLWCDTFPQQAFNRQVVDMIRDHAYVSQHPAMQEYLRRRLQYNFGSIETNAERIISNKKQEENLERAKWDSDVEEGDGEDEIEQERPKKFIQRYQEKKFDDENYIFSPQELAELGNITIPEELLTHPFAKQYIQHQSQLYKSRYVIASDVVAKKLANVQTKYRQQYMSLFKRELGLDDDDIKVHTNATQYEQFVEHNENDDDDYDGNNGVSRPTAPPTLFKKVVNNIRTALGLPIMDDKGYFDPTSMNAPQFPFIFGIPTHLQTQIEYELQPKSSDILYFDNIHATELGDTSSPLLKPPYSIKAITPLTEEAVKNLQHYLNQWHKQQAIATNNFRDIPLNIETITDDEGNIQEIRTDTTMMIVPDVVIGKPIIHPSFSQLTSTHELHIPSTTPKPPFLAHDAEDTTPKQRLYSVELEPFNEPSYLDKINYYDQSFYLFGMSPYEADKELQSKHLENVEYITARHAADEYGLQYYSYLSMLDSALMKSNPEYNKNVNQRKTILEQLIDAENLKLQTNIDERKRLKQQRDARSAQPKLSLTERIQQSLSIFGDVPSTTGAENHELKNKDQPTPMSETRYGSTSSGTANNSRSQRTLRSMVVMPEVDNEEFLDDDDLAAIKYRNGLLQELDSLPLLSPDGTNLSTLQSAVMKDLIEIPFDTKTGKNITGSRLGLPSSKNNNNTNTPLNGPGGSNTLDGALQNQIKSNGIGNNDNNDDDDEDLSSVLEPIFRHIHAGPLQLETFGSVLPVIVASPAIDPVTGEEYLRWFESRRTVDDLSAWKELFFDQHTGELYGDSIEPKDRPVSRLVTLRHPDGSVIEDAIVDLLPRHFDNAFEVLVSDWSKQQAIIRSDAASLPSWAGGLGLPLNRRNNGVTMGKGSDSSSVSGSYGGDEADDEADDDDYNIDKPVNPYLTTVRHLSEGTKHSFEVDQVRKRRDLAAETELDFTDDPFLGELFEEEFGEDYRQQQWKLQDEMLTRAQLEAGYEEVLIPNHQFDHLFSGHYRDYIIDENDSDEIQQEKIVRRRLLVRPLPDLPEREVKTSDLLLTPRPLTNGVKLEFSRDPVKEYELLQQKQLQKQTSHELYKRFKQQRQEAEAQQRLDDSLSSLETKTSFGTTSPADIAEQRWFNYRNEIMVALSQYGIVCDDIDRNPDYYIDLYEQLHVMASNNQNVLPDEVQTELFKLGELSQNNFPTLPTPTIVQFNDNVTGIPKMSAASNHLYNTLFGYNSNNLNTDPAEQSEKHLEKQRAKQSTQRERLIESRRRALLSYGVLPNEFENALAQQQELVLMRQYKELDRLYQNSNDENDDGQEQNQLKQHIINQVEQLYENGPSGGDIYNIVFDFSNKSVLEVQERLNRQRKYGDFVQQRKVRNQQQRNIAQRVRQQQLQQAGKLGENIKLQTMPLQDNIDDDMIDPAPLFSLTDHLGAGLNGSTSLFGLTRPSSQAQQFPTKPRYTHTETLYYRHKMEQEQAQNLDTDFLGFNLIDSQNNDANTSVVDPEIVTFNLDMLKTPSQRPMIPFTMKVSRATKDPRDEMLPYEEAFEALEGY